MKITVDKKFIEQREANLLIYKRGKRTEDKHRQNIDCELYEYEMIKSGEWLDHPMWFTDAITEDGNVEVKFIQKYFNIAAHKRKFAIEKQLTENGSFVFVEKVDWPARALEEGDVVEINVVGTLTSSTVRKNMSSSNYNSGYYVDVRNLV